jgi:hypothetical protein
MSTRHFWISLAVCAATAGGAVAQSANDRADLLREARALRSELAPAATPPGGLDTDSFGRAVRFDGLMQSGVVTLLDDCTPAPGDPPPGPDDRCVVLNPAPAATTFDLADIGRLTLPGRSAHSLLCHWLTPVAVYTLQNPTGVFQPNATIRLIPYVVVESEVLDDPALIDPTTGLPFGGQLESSFAATYQDSQSLDPGQRSTKRFSLSRVCISGFLSKSALMEIYGLTEAQAKQVFKRDMTLRFGLRGNATLVAGASVLYGLRVVGD